MFLLNYWVIRTLFSHLFDFGSQQKNDNNVKRWRSLPADSSTVHGCCQIYNNFSKWRCRCRLSSFASTYYKGITMKLQLAKMSDEPLDALMVLNTLSAKLAHMGRTVLATHWYSAIKLYGSDQGLYI